MEQEQPQIEAAGSVPESATVPPHAEGAPSAEAAQSTASEPSGAAPTPQNQSDGEVEGWLATAQSLLVTVTIAVFVITFIVQAFEIPSPSMEKTLLIGDYLLVDKTRFGPPGHFSWLIPYKKIERGDIVVFHYPRDPQQHFVKRVIGLPGDRIRLHKKRVYVNGKVLTEPYTVFIDHSADDFRDEFPMGNRRKADIDSTWYLQLDRLVEDGQLIVPEGNYFVMGDNRDDSSDSRYWGFVPRENIVGRPLLIYFSMGSNDESDKLALRDFFSRIANQIRWRRVLRIVN